MPVAFDPATGQPILTGSDGSFASQVATGAMANAQMQDSRLFAMAENIPSATSSMAWNALRGSNSILYGAAENTMQQGIWSSLKATFRPKYHARMPHLNTLGGPGVAEGSYTPFQLSDLGNKFAAGYRKGRGLEPAETPLFAEGMVSRVTASARIMTGKFGARQAGNVAKFIENAHPELFKAIGANPVERMAASRSLTSGLNLATTGGRFTNRIGGYLAGMGSHGKDFETIHSIVSGVGGEGSKIFTGGMEAASKAMSKVGAKSLGELTTKGILSSVFKEGGELGVREGAALLGGKYALSAVPVVGQVIGTAMLAYDLTKMTMAAFKGAGEFAKDAYRSFQGSLYKPVMGMGYKDTEVAATSRSRGVMAIQNSRLNMRSMLGNEAGAMAAHFG